MNISTTPSRTALRPTVLAAAVSLLALLAGAVVVTIVDRARFDHLHEAALSCANWSSFAMPATVLGGSWAVLLLFGLAAWLAWAELIRLGFSAADSSRTLSFTWMRILIGLLAVVASLMIWYGAVDAYQTHQQALPTLRGCSP